MLCAVAGMQKWFIVTALIAHTATANRATMQSVLSQKFVEWYEDFTGNKDVISLPVSFTIEDLSNAYWDSMLDSGLETLRIEYKDEGCNPATVQYNAPAKLISETIESDCTANNPDQCSQLTCYLEMTFINNIYTKYFQHDHKIASWDERFSAKGVFHGVAQLANHKGSIKPCGEYPYKFSFKDSNGQYGCCQGKIYKPFNSQYCCDDGTIAVSNKLCPDGGEFVNGSYKPYSQQPHGGKWMLTGSKNKPKQKWKAGR